MSKFGAVFIGRKIFRADDVAKLSWVRFQLSIKKFKIPFLSSACGAKVICVIIAQFPFLRFAFGL